MYRVLRPIYTKTGDATRMPDGSYIHWHRVEFEEVGIAKDMQDAKAKHPPGYWAECYSWVLEPIQIH